MSNVVPGHFVSRETLKQIIDYREQSFSMLANRCTCAFFGVNSLEFAIGYVLFAGGICWFCIGFKNIFASAKRVS